MRGTVSLYGSLRDAMAAIDAGGTEIALAVDLEGRLAGTLTDGDIRRALLGGASINSNLGPYVASHPAVVSSTAGRAEVLDLMQARRISQVPIVDGGKLVGLHLLHEVIGAKQRANWAVVMAGGQGQRLRPITESIPKPMVKVAGRPILERIVLHLVSHGITRVFLSVNYLAAKIEQHFGDGSRFGCRIDYLREDVPLGTGGALSLLPTPDLPVVVMNGDLVTQADIGALLDFHGQGSAVATMGVRRYFHTVPFGCVELSQDQLRVNEKPSLSMLVNAGIYVFDPAVIARIPKGPYALTDVFADVTARAYEIEDDWLDVGQHDQLRLARGAA